MTIHSRPLFKNNITFMCLSTQLGSNIPVGLLLCVSQSCRSLKTFNWILDYSVHLVFIKIFAWAIFNSKIIIFSFGLQIWNRLQVSRLTEILLTLSAIYSFIKSPMWIWRIRQVVGNNLNLQNRIWSFYCKGLPFKFYLYGLPFFEIIHFKSNETHTHLHRRLQFIKII